MRAAPLRNSARYHTTTTTTTFSRIRLANTTKILLPTQATFDLFSIDSVELLQLQEQYSKENPGEKMNVDLGHRVAIKIRVKAPQPTKHSDDILPISTQDQPENPATESESEKK